METRSRLFKEKSKKIEEILNKYLCEVFQCFPVRVVVENLTDAQIKEVKSELKIGEYCGLFCLYPLPHLYSKFFRKS